MIIVRYISTVITIIIINVICLITINVQEHFIYDVFNLTFIFIVAWFAFLKINC